jgi:hypothetical protein
MLPLKHLFETAGGSVLGRDHAHSRKNNQDAHQIITYDWMMVGVICDGCGDPTSPHSELGAQLGSRWIATEVASNIGKNLGFARVTTLDKTKELANQMIGWNYPGHLDDRPKFHQIIRDYFLYTCVGYAISPYSATFFALGDGVIYVNGEKFSLGPFPDNAPPYLSYALLDSSLLTTDPGSLQFQVVCEIPTEELDSWLIGCDGVEHLIRHETSFLPNGKDYVGSIAQFWTNGCYFSNPYATERKLALVNQEYVRVQDGRLKRTPGLLPDDTTLIAGRRIPR